MDVRDEAVMWHFRFGQLNFGGLAKLSKKQLMHGLDIEFKKKFFEDCILRKHPRIEFSKIVEYQVET